MQAIKMLKKGRQGYVCAIDATEPEDLDLNEVLIAKEFPQLFNRCRDYNLTERLSLPLNLYLEVPQYPRHHIEWHPLN